MPTIPSGPDLDITEPKRPKIGGQDVDTGLVCLMLLARYFGLPADGDQLRHQFSESGKELSETHLLRAAKHLGLKAGAVESRWSTCAKSTPSTTTRPLSGT